MHRTSDTQTPFDPSQNLSTSAEPGDARLPSRESLQAVPVLGDHQRWGQGPGPAFRGCLARQQQIVYILWPALFQNKGACAGHRALSRSGGAVPRTLLWRDTRRGVALAVRVGQRALLPPRRASWLTGLGRTQLSRSGHKALALRARCPKPALSFLLSLLILKADPWSLCLRSAPRTPQTNRPPNGAPLCVNREVTTGATSDWKTPPGTAG